MKDGKNWTIKQAISAIKQTIKLYDKGIKLFTGFEKEGMSGADSTLIVLKESKKRAEKSLSQLQGKVI